MNVTIFSEILLSEILLSEILLSSEAAAQQVLSMCNSIG